jgi:hypothetical protein
MRNKCTLQERRMIIEQVADSWPCFEKQKQSAHNYEVKQMLVR